MIAPEASEADVIAAAGTNGAIVRNDEVTGSIREGQQIAQFGKSVDELAAVRNYLPDDLSRSVRPSGWFAVPAASGGT